MKMECTPKGKQIKRQKANLKQSQPTAKWDSEEVFESEKNVPTDSCDCLPFAFCFEVKPFDFPPSDLESRCK
jgi:hypothetical protein